MAPHQHGTHSGTRAGALLLLVLLSPFASADTTATTTTVATLLFPRFAITTGEVVASVIGVGANRKETTYSVKCLSCVGVGGDPRDAWPDPLILVDGGVPGEYSAHYEVFGATADLTCHVPNTDTVTCTNTATVLTPRSGFTVTGTEGPFDTTSFITAATLTGIGHLFVPVTVTAGLEKLTTTTTRSTGGAPAAARPTGAYAGAALGGMALAAGMLL